MQHTLLALALSLVVAVTAYASDADPTTDLWNAIQLKDITLLEKAITRGANLASVGGTDEDPVTPLMRAIETDFIEGAHRLIEARSPVNFVSRPASNSSSSGTYASALTLAARKRDLTVVDALLKKSANPNHVEKWGTSALMLAAQAGNAGQAGLLLAAGANPCRRNIDDEDAATLARKAGHVDLATELASMPCRDLTEQATAKVQSVLGCYLAVSTFDRPIENPDGLQSTVSLVPGTRAKPARLVLNAYVGMPLAVMPEGVAATTEGYMEWDIYLDQGAFDVLPTGVGIDHWIAEVARDQESVINEQTRYKWREDGTLEFRSNISRSAYRAHLASQFVLRPVVCK